MCISRKSVLSGYSILVWLGQLISQVLEGASIGDIRLLQTYRIITETFSTLSSPLHHSLCPLTIDKHASFTHIIFMFLNGISRFCLHCWQKSLIEERVHCVLVPVAGSAPWTAPQHLRQYCHSWQRRSCCTYNASNRLFAGRLRGVEHIFLQLCG